VIGQFAAEIYDDFSIFEDAGRRRLAFSEYGKFRDGMD